MPTASHPDRTPTRPAATEHDSVLPELREMWWETGVRARAQARLFAVFTELPRLVWSALAVSWRADRMRTSVVAATTVGAGVMSAFG
ncbi:ABC transporter ATP-binding protein, partial [Micromonospora azadirachtae]